MMLQFYTRLPGAGACGAGSDLAGQSRAKVVGEACEQGTERRSGFGFVPRLPSRFERGASNRGFVVPESGKFWEAPSTSAVLG